MEAPPPDQPRPPDAVASASGGEPLLPAKRSPSPSSPVSEVKEPGTSTDDSEEVEVWWGSYAGRTMVPDFVLCGLLTVGIFGAAWYSGAWNGSEPLRLTAQLLAGALWLLQGGRWAYRVVSINYRLTTRRLFCDRGFYHPANREVELAHVNHVLVIRGPLERLLGVGRIRVVLQDRTTQPLVLEGVSAPESIAMTIREQVRRARQQGEGRAHEIHEETRKKSDKTLRK